MNIYVGNLPYALTEDELKAIFTEFGEVESVKIIVDKFTDKSKGFGFVEMPSNSDADKAIKALNGKLIKGQNVKVNQSIPGGKSKGGGRRSFSNNRNNTGGGGRRRY
ncbi:MAG: RNA-binding protein [Desulfobacterales bacterium]|nr:RNA-binding protein [Desulfobacterales bacterium]MBF0396774.1 RNA-binding protein [Desulfobacterales bacterium]